VGLTFRIALNVCEIGQNELKCIHFLHLIATV